MIAEFSPAFILIAGAAFVPFLRGTVRSAFMLALPLLAFAYLLNLPHGELGQVALFDLTLTTLRVDKMSLMFGYVFLIAAELSVIYSLHVRDTTQHVAGLVYAGGALGAVFAGDLVSFFIFWEVLALGSVFLIWAARNLRSYRAGMRYLLIHVGSGVLLLTGLLLNYHATGSIAFGKMDFAQPGTILIFIAFGIKCAFPLLHNWLQDAYPEATITGTVLLSAFTTKVAIYALARGFAGTEILIPIGAVMTIYPIFYAVIENDLRRVLAYSMNNQLGFMVVGVGIGTELALNGAVAHAFADILFKGLLFMSMGAVLFRVGTVKASELGGLYKSMPWTASFCIVGAASISALPFFSAFITKSMIMAAAMEEGHFWLWMILLGASAGVVEHAGIKIPYFAFFAHDSGKRCKEAPLNMLFAMGIAALACIGIGSFPGLFYSILPFVTDYHPYSLDHVVTQTQLLFLAALAVFVFIRVGIYPAELRATNLDSDWFYRRLGAGILIGAGKISERGWRAFAYQVERAVKFLADGLHTYHGPSGLLARSWQTSHMAFWTSVVLAAYLLFLYL